MKWKKKRGEGEGNQENFLKIKRDSVTHKEEEEGEEKNYTP